MQGQQAACFLHMYVLRRKNNVCFYLPTNSWATYNICMLLSSKKAVMTISDYCFLLFSGA